MAMNQQKFMIVEAEVDHQKLDLANAGPFANVYDVYAAVTQAVRDEYEMRKAASQYTGGSGHQPVAQALDAILASNKLSDPAEWNPTKSSRGDLGSRVFEDAASKTRIRFE